MCDGEGREWQRVPESARRFRGRFYTFFSTSTTHPDPHHPDGHNNAGAGIATQ